MRYTECRLQHFSSATFLADLDADTVDFTPNFDASQVRLLASHASTPCKQSEGNMQPSFSMHILQPSVKPNCNSWSCQYIAVCCRLCPYICICRARLWQLAVECSVLNCSADPAPMSTCVKPLCGSLQYHCSAVYWMFCRPVLLFACLRLRQFLYTG